MPHPVPSVFFEEFDAVAGPASTVLRPADAAEFGDEDRHVIGLLEVTGGSQFPADHLLVPLQSVNDGGGGDHLLLRAEALMTERKRRVMMDSVNDVLCADRAQTIHRTLSPPDLLLDDHPAVRIDPVDSFCNGLHEFAVVEFRFDADFHFIVEFKCPDGLFPFEAGGDFVPELNVAVVGFLFQSGGVGFGPADFVAETAELQNAERAAVFFQKIEKTFEALDGVIAEFVELLVADVPAGGVDGEFVQIAVLPFGEMFPGDAFPGDQSGSGVETAQTSEQVPFRGRRSIRIRCGKGPVDHCKFQIAEENFATVSDDPKGKSRLFQIDRDAGPEFENLPVKAPAVSVAAFAVPETFRVEVHHEPHPLPRDFGDRNGEGFCLNGNFQHEISVLIQNREFSGCQHCAVLCLCQIPQQIAVRHGLGCQFALFAFACDPDTESFRSEGDAFFGPPPL